MRVHIHDTAFDVNLLAALLLHSSFLQILSDMRLLFVIAQISRDPSLESIVARAPWDLIGPTTAPLGDVES
jgi:hypothetical protein